MVTLLYDNYITIIAERPASLRHAQHAAAVADDFAHLVGLLPASHLQRSHGANCCPQIGGSHAKNVRISFQGPLKPPNINVERWTRII